MNLDSRIQPIYAVHMPLTKNDLNQISQLLDSKLDSKLEANNKDLIDRLIVYMDKRFTTKEDFEGLEEKISHLPTKEEFFHRMDKITGQYTEFTTEKAGIISKQSDQNDKLESHNSRIEVLESSLALN